uniref:STMF1.15 protein n=1 Tax=Salmonella typhimurium (strain LT2 / SGSC1412 / ATCC 700720) TaxID=99287 RepID=Q9L9J4_SALTY|nr:hypothetical protein predicted by Glimmer with TBLASTX similarity to S. paratyphi and S. typhi unfinished genomic sequence [Salmonella enterica subsp. enterica serovar Typhimurium str. LT2]
MNKLSSFCIIFCHRTGKTITTVSHNKFCFCITIKIDARNGVLTECIRRWDNYIMFV